MFRYDYHVPGPQDQDSSDPDIVSRIGLFTGRSSITSSTTPPVTLARLLEAEAIMEIRRRRKCITGVLLILAVVISSTIFIVYGLSNRDPPLEDIYPDKIDKMTVVFPDQITQDEPIAEESVSISNHRPAENVRVSTTKSKAVSEPEPLSATSEESFSTSPKVNVIASKSASSSDDTAEVCRNNHPKKKFLTEKIRTSSQNARQALHSIYTADIEDHYTCVRCDKDVYEFKLKIPGCSKIFGPAYAVGKKNSKELVAAEACLFLYNLNFTTQAKPAASPYFACDKHCN